MTMTSSFPSFSSMSFARLSIVSGWKGSQGFLNKHEAAPQRTLSASHIADLTMSNSHPTAAAAIPSSNFQLIFNNALNTYKKRTKKDLLAHPLAAELQKCNSPTAILAVLHQQVQGLDRSPSEDRWTKWLDPTVNVLYMFSETLGEGISLVNLTNELV